MDERVAHGIAGLKMFKAHPFFGVGIGNYQDVYAQYHLGVFVLPLGHAHNYYIKIAAETGIFGFIAFLLFLIAVFTYGVRSYRSIERKMEERRTEGRKTPPYGNDRALAIGLMGSLISVCVHNLVDNLYVHAMTSLFALLIVLLVRLPQIRDA